MCWVIITIFLTIMLMQTDIIVKQEEDYWEVICCLSLISYQSPYPKVSEIGHRQPVLISLLSVKKFALEKYCSKHQGSWINVTANYILYRARVKVVVITLLKYTLVFLSLSFLYEFFLKVKIDLYS